MVDEVVGDPIAKASRRRRRCEGRTCAASWLRDPSFPSSDEWRGDHRATGLSPRTFARSGRCSGCRSAVRPRRPCVTATSPGSAGVVRATPPCDSPCPATSSARTRWVSPRPTSRRPQLRVGVPISTDPESQSDPRRTVLSLAPVRECLMRSGSGLACSFVSLSGSHPLAAKTSMSPVRGAKSASQTVGPGRCSLDRSAK